MSLYNPYVCRQHTIHKMETTINEHLLSRAKEIQEKQKSRAYCLAPIPNTSCASCLSYDPQTFKDSTSMVTYFPGGRLGNTLTAYLNLLWLKLEHGLDTYFEKQSKELLEQYFEKADEHKVLEEDLCNWKGFPFQRYENNIELLGRPEWNTGKAIEVYISQHNFMRHEILGGRKYYKRYRKQSFGALVLKQQFRRHAELTLEQVAKKVKTLNNIKNGKCK